MTTTAFADALDAANKVIRRSHLGCVKWFGKRKTAAETSAFSAEFHATRHCGEDTECLRPKLRMRGMPFDKHESEARTKSDDEAIVKNSSRLKAALSERHPVVARHSTIQFDTHAANATAIQFAGTASASSWF